MVVLSPLIISYISDDGQGAKVSNQSRRKFLKVAGKFSISIPFLTGCGTNFSSQFGGGASSFRRGTPSQSTLPLSPELLVGWGKDTTGGRGGKFVLVTNLSDDIGTANSLRWALAQYPGQGLYIALAVEGNIAMESPLKISRPNVTLDGRYSPGQGCWMTGGRIEIEANNVFLDGIRHYGNDPAASDISQAFNSSDNLRWGAYNTDPLSSVNIDYGYARRCSFLYGRDEGMTINSRDNDQATGNKARYITWERCLLGYTVGGGNTPDHKFASFIGNGTENFSWINSLISGHDQRMPFMRQYTKALEIFNCAFCGGNENWGAMITTCESHLQGNLLRLGARWNNVRAPWAIEAGTRTYVGENSVDSKIGKSNKWGLTRGVTPLSSPAFTSSGYAIRPSSTVSDFMTEANVGALVYGGNGTNEIDALVISNFAEGNVVLANFPGLVPISDGEIFPSSEGGVPQAYLAAYPGDTNPEAIISEGGAWDGYMVAERVGAWLVSDKFVR